MCFVFSLPFSCAKYMYFETKFIVFEEIANYLTIKQYHSQHDARGNATASVIFFGLKVHSSVITHPLSFRLLCFIE